LATTRNSGDQWGQRVLIADTGYNDGHTDPDGYHYSVYWMYTVDLAAWSYNRGYSA